MSWYSYKKYCLTFFHKNFYTYHVVYLFSRKIPIVLLYYTGGSNKHGNSVTNSRSSLLRISIVIPDFKSHNIIMSARVYFIKTVNGCEEIEMFFDRIFFQNVSKVLRTTMILLKDCHRLSFLVINNVLTCNPCFTRSVREMNLWLESQLKSFKGSVRIVLSNLHLFHN